MYFVIDSLLNEITNVFEVQVFWTIQTILSFLDTWKIQVASVGLELTNSGTAEVMGSNSTEAT